MSRQFAFTAFCLAAASFVGTQTAGSKVPGVPQTPTPRPVPTPRVRRAQRPQTRPAPPTNPRPSEPIIAETSNTGTSARPRPQATPTLRPRPAQTAPEAPTFTAPRLLWKTFLRRVDGSPAAIEETVYIGAGTSLHQLDSGGRTSWTTETGPQQSSPTFDDTRVFIGSDAGTVYALNRKTGGVLWKFNAGGPIQTRPTLANGRVIVESSDNTVYALDAQTGGLKWKFTRPDGALGYSSPVFDGSAEPDAPVPDSAPKPGEAIVANTPATPAPSTNGQPTGAVYVGGDSNLYRLDAQTGREVWRVPVGGKSLSTATAAGGRVYVGSDGAGVVALNRKDGSPAWSFLGKVPKDWFGPPLVAGDTVYVSTYNRYVYALDAATGKQKWSQRLLGNALARPALDVRRNTLYVTSATFRDNPTLTALDAKNGNKLWDFRMGYVSGSPLVTGNRLYIGSTTGFFYAFRLN